MIREYGADDACAVMEIWLEGNRTAHHFLPDSYWQEHYEEVRDQYLPASLTFVEEEEGRICGFASLVPGERYYIGALFVSPQQQGKGTGTRLLNRCKEVWPELTLDVFAENSRAMQFYRNNGFVPTSDRVKQGTGCYEYSMVYRKPLETERLYLRNWKLEDAEDLYEYAKDDRVGPSAGWKPHGSVEESKEIIGQFILELEAYAIVLKESQKVIGSIGLHKHMPDLQLASLRQREVGYVLNPAFWGNGYMPEAVRCLLDYGFDELELELMWCSHYDFNQKSRRVIEKCGFRYQFPKKVRRPALGDVDVNLLCYSIRNEDYRKDSKR